MKVIEKHICKVLAKPVRLQEYATGIFTTIPTKSGIKKAIKKSLVLVNKKVASTGLFIHGFETIELLSEEEIQPKKKFHFKVEVFYEDDYLAIINKPAGIVVSGNSFATINNCLPQNLKKSTLPGACFPRAVHRLDYPTSGLLLIGKTHAAVVALSKLFEKKRIDKTYHAITIGKMQKQGSITLAIDTKSAVTHFSIQDTVNSVRFHFLNLVLLQPKTGRKHQLRKHLLSLSNPILGDQDYFLPELRLKGKGLYLCATGLAFTHPFTKKLISINRDLPKKFKKIFSS